MARTQLGAIAVKQSPTHDRTRRRGRPSSLSIQTANRTRLPFGHRNANFDLESDSCTPAVALDRGRRYSLPDEPRDAWRTCPQLDGGRYRHCSVNCETTGSATTNRVIHGRSSDPSIGDWLGTGVRPVVDPLVPEESINRSNSLDKSYPKGVLVGCREER